VEWWRSATSSSASSGAHVRFTHCASRGMDACRAWRPAVSPATSSCTRRLNSKQTTRSTKSLSRSRYLLRRFASFSAPSVLGDLRQVQKSNIWHQRGYDLGTMCLSCLLSGLLLPWSFGVSVSVGCGEVFAEAENCMTPVPVCDLISI
jgi:hypothetical protein